MKIEQTDEFALWLRDLKDTTGRNRILARIDRLRFGNPGDAKSVGGGVTEMRVHHGPGYRLYFLRRGETPTILLAGGDKSTQRRDIENARRLAALY